MIGASFANEPKIESREPEKVTLHLGAIGLTNYEDHVLCPSQQLPSDVSAFLYAAGIGAIRHF